jgi:hypothetical protein
MNLNVEELENVTCENCGNDTFVKVFVLKRVSPLLTGELKERIIEINIQKCDSCNHISEQFSSVRHKVASDE